jgi:uncharacterized membrane protein YqjE
MESNYELDDDYMKFFEISLILNIFFTIVFIFIGLCGNFIILIVYSQSKNRVNASNIFIFCLAIFESIFLMLHFFEDTIRTIRNTKRLFQNNIDNYDLIEKLNVIDNNYLMCSISNYLRYTIRFIQSYTVSYLLRIYFLNLFNKFYL